jgi:hypothetical protein
LSFLALLASDGAALTIVLAIERHAIGAPALARVLCIAGMHLDRGAGAGLILLAADAAGPEAVLD